MFILMRCLLLTMLRCFICRGSSLSGTVRVVLCLLVMLCGRGLLMRVIRIGSAMVLSRFVRSRSFMVMVGLRLIMLIVGVGSS